MNKIILKAFLILSMTVSLSYADAMVGKRYSIEAQLDEQRIEVTGDVVEKTNEYIRIMGPKGIEKFKMNQILYMEEKPVIQFSQDQKEILNKNFDQVEHAFNKSTESAQNNCAEYGEKIKKCESYECSFSAVGGKTFSYKILGFEGNKCHFLQEVSGVFRLDCRLSRGTLSEIEKHNKLISDARHAGKKIGYGFAMSTNEQSTSHVTINGQAIEDPFQAAIKNGECVQE